MSKCPDSIEAREINKERLERSVFYLCGEGACERLDGGAVGLHLDVIPPPQLPHGALDRRLAGLGIRHRSARPTTTTESITNPKAKQRRKHGLVALLEETSHSRVDYVCGGGGGGGGRVSGGVASRRGRLATWVERKQEEKRKENPIV